jgi:hypothetical protein
MKVMLKYRYKDVVLKSEVPSINRGIYMLANADEAAYLYIYYDEYHAPIYFYRRLYKTGGKIPLRKISLVTSRAQSYLREHK